MQKKIADVTVSRLSIYYRILEQLENTGEEVVSSEQLAARSGNTADQVRKDITNFGSFGVPGSGYNVSQLRSGIGKVLGKDESLKMAIVGVGNLGSALLAYKEFKAQGFEIAACFDNEEKKVGKKFKGVQIDDIKNLKSVIKKRGIQIGIITVPEGEAQDVAKKLVESGVKGVLNFAPCRLDLPENVILINVDLSVELDKLSYYLESINA